jgi:hypothetical protein
VTFARRAGLVAAVAVAFGAVAGSALTSQEPVRKGVRLFVVPRVSFEELLAVPEVAALARAGGAAIMVDTGEASDDLARNAEAVPGPKPIVVRELDPAQLGGLDRVGELIREAVTSARAENLLVIVLSATASEAMHAAKDDAHPVVLARGGPDAIFDVGGSPRTLTSDSTHRVGVVSDTDVWPTITAWQGADVPTDLKGSVIRVVDAPPPFELHERYLDMRRMTVPIGTAAGLYVAFGGLFAIGVVLAAWRGHVSPVLGRIASGIALSVPVLAAALLAAGHLPTLSYATVVPFVVGATVAATVAALACARRDLLRGPVLIAVGVLVFLVVAAALGWTAALTPFLGGSTGCRTSRPGSCLERRSGSRPSCPLGWGSCSWSRPLCSRVSRSPGATSAVRSRCSPPRGCGRPSVAAASDGAMPPSRSR